jgi:hypothetical protein
MSVWSAWIGVTLFNYVIVQIGAILQTRADRDFYRARVDDIRTLERLGVHARRVRVRADPGATVSIGTGYEDGWPEEVQEAAWLSSEAVTFVDDAGRVWTLEPDVSLYISGAQGFRKRVGQPDKWDFAMTSDRSFYLLVTEEGPYKIRRRGPGFSDSDYYHLTPKLEDLEREVTPRGPFAAWLMLVLTPLVIAASRMFMPGDIAAQNGLLMLFSGFCAFAVLDGHIFGLPLIRHRPREPMQRWRPEVRTNRASMHTSNP